MCVDTDESSAVSDRVGHVDRQPDGRFTDRSNVEQQVAEASHAAHDALLAVLSIQPLPTADFNHLRLLATYSLLPRSLANATRPLQLARDRFFYVGRRRVRCFSCGVVVPLLGGHRSSPQEEHRVLSPDCPLVGDGHPFSEALLRDVLHWMPLAVQIR